MLVVSLLALGADFILVFALTFFFDNEISTYPVVKQVFDWYKIGSAFLVFFVAGIHAVFSSYSQIKFEVENIK